jgi:hypothetical protein
MGLLDSILGRDDESDDQWTLFFASDLHGSDKCFRKFVNAKQFYDADELILGGDLTGKAIVPIVDTGETWRAEYPNQSKTLQSEDAVEETEQQVKNAGNYPLRMDEAEYEAFREDDDRVASAYEELEAERIREWIDVAEDKLDDRIYVITGNDDGEYVAEYLEDSSAFALVDGSVTRLESGHEIFGYGWSNPTPWDTPREKPDDEIRADLDAIGAEVTDWSRAIGNVHCPPHGTRIDEAPKLDDDLRPVTSGGQVEQEPVGSEAVGEFLEERQPLLGLHGHIHESQGEYELGRTLCLNPGSEYGEGYLNGALVTIRDDAVVRHQFTSG